jgi:hypothetical protein
LDTQELDQGQGLIAKNERIIKLHGISNPTISLDCYIPSNQRSTTVVDPPTITQLKIAKFGRHAKPRASYSYEIHTDRRWSPRQYRVIGSSKVGG